MFMVPTKLLPTVTTPLFSLGTKIRMGLEYFRAPKAAANGRDESVAELSPQQHYGAEMVERLADPLLAGVYGGDADSLSAAAVLPRFVDMERQYGSLSRGMLASRKKIAGIMREKHGENHRPQPALLFAEKRYAAVGGCCGDCFRESVNLNRDITALLRDDEKWRLVSAGGVESFDALVLAAPAQLAGRLISGAAPTLANELLEISYSSSVTVTGIYNRADLRNLPPGFGFLVPKTEGKRMLACTLRAQQISASRAGRSRHHSHIPWWSARRGRILSLSDAEILATVRRELKDIVGLEAEPRAERVYRWNRSMAQYGPGHLARVQRIKDASKQLRQFALAGNAYQGIGVPDCIASETHRLQRIYWSSFDSRDPTSQ